MAADLLDFTCPRCARPAVAEFYGPCEDCRAAMRTAFAGQARDVTAERFEPKMNVTPNAVATKE